jgi:VWFA-related protein
MRDPLCRLFWRSEGLPLGRSAIFAISPSPFALAILLACVPLAFGAHALQKERLPRPRQLDSGITWWRDPATGELRAIVKGSVERNLPPGAAQPGSGAIRVVTELVPVTCSVSTVDGTPVPGLKVTDFRIFEDSVEQHISYFDASQKPASVALVLDASPSVLPDSEEMKLAANALIDALAPLDQGAVVDFSAHTYLQTPFTDVREIIRRAVARVDVRELLGDTGGSNIYEAVYLTARELFPGHTGRKAIVLLTDGQDSGLGLNLDPASESPRPGRPNDLLTFDDVARALAAEDIQIFAVSTENRPKVMTPEWLAAHRNVTLVTRDVHRLGIPPYTLYLAELVRRSGGQLYFLRETKRVSDTFGKIADRIRAEYTLGYYPAQSSTAPHNVGWHRLRVDVAGGASLEVTHRAAYYIPASS